MIYQFDATAATNNAIITSKQIVATGAGGAGGMQLGPDGKIYLSAYVYAGGYLSCIQNPNVVGTACNYQDSAVYLSGRRTLWGLPGIFIPASVLQSNSDFTFSVVCLNDSVLFTLNNTQDVQSVSWNFGDPFSGTENSSILISPTHLFSSVSTPKWFRIGEIILILGSES